MKTRKFCPHCGRPLKRSRNIAYTYECIHCDEDFYHFEALGIRHIERVRELRCSQQNEVKGVIISRALLEEYGYNGSLLTNIQLRTIANELLTYWGVSGDFSNALESVMSSFSE